MLHFSVPWRLTMEVSMPWNLTCWGDLCGRLHFLFLLQSIGDLRQAKKESWECVYSYIVFIHKLLWVCLEGIQHPSCDCDSLSPLLLFLLCTMCFIIETPPWISAQILEITSSTCPSGLMLAQEEYLSETPHPHVSFCLVLPFNSKFPSRQLSS